MELFNEWREELQAELKKLEAELEAAEQSAEAAAAAAKAARAKRVAVNEAFNKLHPNASVAGVLDVRRYAVADDHQRLEGGATAARLRAQNLHHQIKDLREGIDQLEIIARGAAKPEFVVHEPLLTMVD
jgi:chromosome segregation ATPase